MPKGEFDRIGKVYAGHVFDCYDSLITNLTSTLPANLWEVSSAGTEDHRKKGSMH